MFLVVSAVDLLGLVQVSLSYNVAKLKCEPLTVFKITFHFLELFLFMCTCVYVCHMCAHSIEGRQIFLELW